MIFGFIVLSSYLSKIEITCFSNDTYSNIDRLNFKMFVWLTVFSTCMKLQYLCSNIIQQVNFDSCQILELVFE